MQIHNARSLEKSIEHKDIDGLLACRMSMLGLDLFAIEKDNDDTLEEIMQHCVSCDYREACAMDMKRDPNNSIWEAYCPNAEALLWLAETSWFSC